MICATVPDPRRRDERSQEKWLTLPGNYPAYYAAIRDALNGVGKTRSRPARRFR